MDTFHHIQVIPLVIPLINRLIASHLLNKILILLQGTQNSFEYCAAPILSFSACSLLPAPNSPFPITIISLRWEVSLLPLCLRMLLLLSAVSTPTPASLFCNLIPVQPKYRLFKEAILICTPIYAFLLRYPSSINFLTPCHLSQCAIHHNKDC